jgi:AhpD family alkylhydroperoxidase
MAFLLGWVRGLSPPCSSMVAKAANHLNGSVKRACHAPAWRATMPLKKVAGTLPRAVADGTRNVPATLRGVIMPTVKLVDENCADPIVQRVFRDIKETKKIDFVPDIWRALATHPQHLELCWTRLKAIMSPGKLDALTKEIIALAVSVTNSCKYCINSHTAAVQKLGLDQEGIGELLAVVGLFNQMNKLADAYQVEPDILPRIGAGR